jgi:hypothetical protein
VSDAADYAAWVGNYGAAGAAMAVPEPASAVGFGVAWLVAAKMRGRRAKT